MDKIIISGFPVNTVIGTFPEERKQTQKLIFSLTLSGDFSEAGRTDTLSGTVNYRELEEKLIDLVEHSSCFLVEALAEKTAQLCLSYPEVTAVTVRIEKPAAALRGECIAVEIERSATGV
ncbi:MAG: dihydroneopterin aldolase [Lentisphaeria bacterium]|nr:dihydroneopterin aldolase [Lentisphaeria bacterium]